MKRVPHLFRPGQYNLDGDWLFQRAAPGLNAVASAVCGWLHQGQCGNQLTAQLLTKAEIAAHLYTAKRMIHVLLLAFRPQTFTTVSGLMDHEIHDPHIEDFTLSSLFEGKPQMTPHRTFTFQN